MPRSKHLLAFVHGMQLSHTFEDVAAHTFRPFFEGMGGRAAFPELGDPVFTAWGDGLPDGDGSGDRGLRNAQRNLLARTGVANAWADDLYVPALRGLLREVRERVVTLGFTDVIYYTGAEGEGTVRRRLYGQILSELDRRAPSDEPTVLHLIAHSLGATISFDLLFGLFNRDPAYVPDFPSTPLVSDAAAESFRRWRKRAHDGALRLGSLTTMASQLPIFAMRKQRLVDILARDQTLDVQQIGLRADDPIERWHNFFDGDDLMAFPVAGLFGSPAVIRDLPLSAGLLPEGAHVGYWQSEVAQRVAARAVRNAIDADR